MKKLLFTAALCAQLSVMLGVTAFAASTDIWDIGELGLFDASNKAYPINQGRVTVDLHSKGPLCPTGLGHLASGRKMVKEIVFTYRMNQAGNYWLTITWNPGGSGKEQFEVLCNGKSAGKSALRDGSLTPYQDKPEQFQVEHKLGQNILVLRFLSGNGLHFKKIALSTGKKTYTPLSSYEEIIKERGVMLDDKYVRLFAPKRKEREAHIIFGYLVKAYYELYRIVGVHTKSKIVVHHFPENNPNFSGGTSECTIRYGYKNLDFASQEEWTQYKVPHISGYIEEMAHNFVDATKAQFGWEMVGWTISIKASEKVAGNPLFRKSLQETRKKQKNTLERYQKSNNTFPKNIPSNLCDRIHAYLLWECEKQYGEKFWPDFFKEVRKERSRFIAAEKLSGDEGRNARYRITIECFDRLMKGGFKKILKKNGISLTTDIKSLHPTDPGWNRKFK